MLKGIFSLYKVRFAIKILLQKLKKINNQVVYKKINYLK